MLNNHGSKAAVTVIGKVDKYVYLDKTVERDGGIRSEIRRRIAVG